MGNKYTKEHALDQFMNILYGVSTANKTQDDSAFRDSVTQEITNRDQQYTNLLKHFVKITSIRNYLKEFFKWSFYLAVIASICGLIYIIYQTFNAFITKASMEQMIEAIPLFITSIVGFVSVIIAIPLAITKYLFSAQEDKNITDIIQHTQNHDNVGRQWALDFKKFVADNTKSENENKIENKGYKKETEKIAE